MPTRHTVVTPPASLVTKGRNNRSFHAPRATSGFTQEPPGFQTEKDPRGKPDNKWFDLPHPTGSAPYRLDLSTVLSEEAMRQITARKRLVFHAVGDTGGVNTTTYQAHVAAAMELDFRTGVTDGSNPSFFYHLGDVVYYDGEVKNYYWEFYEPYLHYPGPIFAIPGNHDGDVDPGDEFNSPSDSLKGFVRNFCAPAAVHLPEADDAPRDAMTQPNVYWTLTTPVATIIGLYTNVPEGGQVDQAQLKWFTQELTFAAGRGGAVIVALHHPPYSAFGHHPGSLPMKRVLEQASAAAGRVPDLVLSGHVHDYQRFTGRINRKDVTCIVAGAGGYNQRLHRLDASMFKPDGVPYRFEGGEDTLEAFNDTQHGYMTVDVTTDRIVGRYFTVADPANETVPSPRVADTFEIPLA